MKMNKKSHTLLNLAIAASLFAFAACSDYLEDFQDKYDDGKAFAEISSDSDNDGDDGKSSSSSGGDDGSSDSKLSSSNGGDSELSSSSDDSKLSSSSKGNGDAESSDSSDSSSSATDPGSSSSVAESSSSAKTSCDGTVIYEPNMSNAFGEGVRILKNNSPVKDETDGFELGTQTAYLLKFDTQNISDWGGLCIEYTTTYSFGIAVNNISDSITQTMIQTIGPGKHAISEVPWDNGSWDLLAIDNHSQQIDHIPNTSAILNEASQIFIRPSTSTESYGDQAKIHKITTMKQVDLKINSFQDGLVAVEKCDGDHQIIYNAPETKNVSSWGTNFFSIFTPETNATYSSTKKVLSMSMTAPESYQMNMVEVNEAETKDWGGLCIEYEADHPLFWSVSLLQNIASNQNTWDMGPEAAVVLPKTEGIKAYKISWKKFGELKNNSFAGIINAMQFHHAKADEYHVADKSYNIEDYKATVNLGIQRITSYN